MDRREFFKRLLGGAAGALVAHTLDLDKLLWVPGERTIFLPPVVPVTPNTFDVTDWLTRESLRLLTDKLRVVEHFNREYAPSRSRLQVPFPAGLRSPRVGAAR